MAKTFRGGIHPLNSIHHGKGLSMGEAIRLAQAPEVVAIPMSQHIGAPCEPVVKPGDRVLKGQLVGQVRGYVAAPVHASVSGVVKALEPRLVTGGATPLCVVIENDGQDEWDPSLAPLPLDAAPEALLERVLQAGVVGMGGATFPAHVKFSPPKDKQVEMLLLNGAECEPYLTADHRMMVERAADIVGGMQAVARILSAKACLIGIEENKPDAIEAMGKAASGAGFTVVPMPVKYPQGSEKQLIQTLTGRQVPSGKLPMDAGCVVVNASTAAAVFDAVTKGRPLVQRVVSVTGEGIARPANLLTPIGTPVSALIEQCGGLAGQVERVVSGGPMMGIALYDLDVPVTKGTSGVLALLKERVKTGTQTNCIRCGRCLRGCPIHLMPFELANDVERGDWAAADQHNALDCMECGSCTYVCPAKREITSAIRVAKRQVLAARKK